MKFGENATKTVELSSLATGNEQTSSWCDETHIVVAIMGSYSFIDLFVHLLVFTTIILHLYIRF